jgi:hypothetical protein
MVFIGAIAQQVQDLCRALKELKTRKEPPTVEEKDEWFQVGSVFHCLDFLLVLACSFFEQDDSVCGRGSTSSDVYCDDGSEFWMGVRS